jgi:hypothetical protein
MAGKQDSTVFALEPLLAALCTPPNDPQTAAAPATLFLRFSSTKKSLLKPLSVNFYESLVHTAL